jgi:hypothetical protein
MLPNYALVIPDAHSVHHVDLDAAEPYCLIRPDAGDMEPETRLLIPPQLAYYLRTHWCGSQKMHDLIERNTRLGIQEAIKEALGIER